MAENMVQPSSAEAFSDDLFELCDIKDVTADTPFKAEMDGQFLAVFEVDGKYYAVQDGCTHGPGSLSEGYVEDAEVECPFHQGRFDVTTGAPTGAPCTIPLQTWKVTVRGSKICVDRKQHPPESH